LRARGARAYNGGLGATAPSGVQGRANGGGQGTLKLKAFLLFPYKRAKSLVLKLKKTPMFGPWGWGGGPVRPYLDPPVRLSHAGIVSK